MKLLTFTIVGIFMLVRHAGDFLGMISIIEHLMLKVCRFTLKTNNLFCLNHPNVLQMLFLNQLLMLLNWLGWNVTSMMKMHESYHMLNSQVNMFGINQIKKTKTESLGRINHVSPKSGDVYYLRILLNKAKGPTCYEDIRTVNSTVYESYKDVCDALEYISSIHETHHWAIASFCRSLFVMLITSDSLCRPHHVFKVTYNCLFDDVVHIREQEIGQIPNMPLPEHKYIQDSCNMLIQDKLNYDPSGFEVEHQQLHSKLNFEQKKV
uniref:Uncharacterized protein n=1 Tax=Lactuca sativa TaxID=4236 RepID=A0A9R1UPC8_LACSA|nr:hypothetical protein LSAT_V11C800411840 [Lactuca sativa]